MRKVYVMIMYEAWVINFPTFLKQPLISEKLAGREATFAFQTKKWKAVNCPSDFLPKPILETAKALTLELRSSAEEEKTKEEFNANILTMKEKISGMEQSLAIILERLNSS